MVCGLLFGGDKGLMPITNSKLVPLLLDSKIFLKLAHGSFCSDTQYLIQNSNGNLERGIR